MARLTRASRKGLSSHLKVNGGTIPAKIPVLPAGPIPTSPIEKEIISPKVKTIDKFAGIKIQHQGKQLTVQEFQKANPTKRLQDIPGMEKALKKAAKANIRLNRAGGGIVAKMSRKVRDQRKRQSLQGGGGIAGIIPESIKKQIETFRGGGIVKHIGGAGAVKFVNGKFVNIKSKKAS